MLSLDKIFVKSNKKGRQIGDLSLILLKKIKNSLRLSTLSQS